MTRKITLHVPQVGNQSNTTHEPARVSLPAPPWNTLEITDRSETAPRTRTIRAKGRDPFKADPVIRHADTRKDRG